MTNWPQAIIPKVLAVPEILPAIGDGQTIIVIVTTRSKGRLLARNESVGNQLDATLTQAMQNSFVGSGIAHQPDALQIEIGYALQKQDPERAANVHSGKRGLALFRDQQLLDVVGGLDMIDSNRTLPRALDRLLESHGLERKVFAASNLQLFWFKSIQMQVWLADKIRVVPLYRGNILVKPEEINRGRVIKLATGMTEWMRNQVDDSGRILYKYWPSIGKESDADNSIRQVMATVCLGRIANRSKSASDRVLADRNLNHLLSRYYREDGEHGLIVEGQEKAKLGAASLAALAILEHPEPMRYQEPFQRLVNTVNTLSQADGSFRTFYWPSERNDNQNFYPGETLLFWAIALQRDSNATTPERYLASARYYREFFRSNSNPAFVPWHTQAHVNALQVFDAPEIADFVFEMNDWLLQMVQWDSAPYPDLMGRFYNPKRPDFGPPHASSTGVYLEGLIDAWQLAKDRGMESRAEQYGIAIGRGLRSLCQLQFSTAEDMFYVARKKAVAGGLRTEVYDNSIRVDNVQHGLMGLHRIIDRFLVC